MKIPNLYKRLSKRGSILNQYSLWAAPDHLISISASIFSEEYKRFYFQDIQTLILHKTEAWRVWNWLLGGLGAIFVLVAIASKGPVAVFAGIVSAMVLLILSINYVLGATCACYIQTAVQKERLYTLNRIRRAQKILDSLKPSILGAQRKSEPSSLDQIQKRSI